MRDGVVIYRNDLKQILAEYFGVDESKVIEYRDFWVVVTSEEKPM
jgi:hypothetical protein